MGGRSVAPRRRRPAATLRNHAPGDARCASVWSQCDPSRAASSALERGGCREHQQLGHPDRATSRCFWCAACSAIPRWPPGCANSANPFTHQHFYRPGRGRSPSCASAPSWAASTSGVGRPPSGARSRASATTSATHWSPAAKIPPRIRDGAPRTDADRGGRRAGAHRVVVGGDLDRIGGFLDDEQRIELLTAVGWYRTICTLCNALALPVEGWMRRWPGSAR